MNLKAFGQTLRTIRKQSGLTQAELAHHLPVSPELISIWERAYQHQDRKWKPDRSSVLRLLEIFADKLTIDEVQRWTGDVGYRLGKKELRNIFPDNSRSTLTSNAGRQAEERANYRQLNLTVGQQLFGVDQAQTQIQEKLHQPDTPWLVAIDGIGGIGKTSLAMAVASALMESDRFHDLAWISAKQETFLPESGLADIARPALDKETLTAALLEQLDDKVSLHLDASQRVIRLTQLLKARPYLVVIDNLETVADYHNLLPFLHQLMSPTKFLLTSRHRLYAHSHIFCYTLDELDQQNTFDFINNQAEIRGLSVLMAASSAHLEKIYQVVGGNPLALKLVIGQTGVLPLSQVLDNLKQAQGKKTEDLYTYIYWQAWNALEPTSQDVLLVMPLAQGGALPQLAHLTQFGVDILTQALDYLVGLSLIHVRGDLDKRHYFIHRLTETFLLKEVIKWQEFL